MHPTISRSRSRRLAWCLVPAAVALAAAAIAPGVSFTMRSASCEGVCTQPDMGQVSRVRVQGQVMRFESDPSAQRQGESFEQGAYTLADMPNRRIVVVMPESKRYMEMRLDDSTSTALTAAMSSTAMLTDVKVDGASLGSGGTVGGMETSKYRLTTHFKYTSTTGSDGGATGTMHVVEEYWVSDALKDVIDPVEQIGRTLGARGGVGASPFAALGGSSLGDMMEKRYAAQRKLFSGMPVKTVTTTTDVDASGTKKESMSFVEVGDVQKSDMDPALFAIPDGYTKFDMKQLMNVGAQMKNAFKGLGQRKSGEARGATGTAGTTDSTAANAPKPSAADQAKKAMGGLLKRRP
jgi:hypothetical protein